MKFIEGFLAFRARAPGSHPPDETSGSGCGERRRKTLVSGSGGPISALSGWTGTGKCHRGETAHLGKTSLLTRVPLLSQPAPDLQGRASIGSRPFALEAGT
jgi:hypothetical protein